MHSLNNEFHSVEKQIAKIITLNFPNASFKDLKIFLLKLKIHHKPKIITITGSNGKGSTVEIISHILWYNNISHICHTSPHIQRFNERISYNRKNIDDNDLTIYINRIYSLCLKLNFKLHYHFIAFLCTWLHIEKKQPEWAILEVGIGGQFDPANLFDADIAVLTTVSLDHCNLLGDNIETIALTKAHIARSKKPIIIGNEIPRTALNFLTHIGAKIIQADYNHSVKNYNIHPNSIACSLSAIKQITQKIDFPPYLSTLKCTGRMQIIHESPLIIVDVAHNPQACSNLFNQIVSTIKKSIHRRIVALFTTNQHKDIELIIKSTNNIFNLWLVPNLNKLDQRLIEISKVQVRKLFPKNSLFFENQTSCFDYVMHNMKTNDLIVAFGSFVLIGELIKYYDQK